MKKFIKILSGVLSVIMLLSVAACSKRDKQEDEEEETTTDIEEPEKTSSTASRAAHSAYLIDDTYYYTVREKPMSGWTYDGRGAAAQTTETGIYNSLDDISSEYGTAYIREFNKTEAGVITLETKLQIYCNGSYQELLDDEGNVTYKIYFDGSSWSVLGENGEYTSICEKNYGSEYAFKIIINLDNGTAKTYIDNKDCGESKLLSDNIINYRFGTDEESTGKITRSGSLIYANYSVYDIFSYLGADEIYGWSLSGRTKVVSEELFVLAGDATRTFEPITGKVCAETYFILPKNGETSIKLSDGDTDVLTLNASGGTLSVGDSDIYDLVKNMWYRLHIEADLDEGTADIYLNGRVIATVDVEKGSQISSVKLISENAKFDNIKVYGIYEPDDYVSAPEVTSDDDYRVGMLSCNLWHTGFDEGWNLITAYEDRIPVLGYYDEGIPEVADWETKYMVEHGVDFQVYCWYNDAETGAVKTPYRISELHDGYMYSKYGSYLDYAIMWELQSGTSRRVDMEQFKNNIVPYWFENYFLDERYLVIDNKPVLYLYSASRMYDSEYFGSVEEARKAVEYLNEVARDYGFDGVLLSATGGKSDVSNYLKIGLNGMFSYGFGQGNSTAPVVDGNTLIAKEIAARTTSDFYMIPSISTGFNNIPFSGTRTDCLDENNFRFLLKWAKGVYMPTYAKDGGWASDIVMFSSWNEYGEGKFMMPTVSDGFMYLDLVRSELSGITESHKETLPTDSQKERLTRMFPQYQSRLYSQGYYKAGKLQAANAISNAELYINGKLVKSEIPALLQGQKVLFAVDESTGVNYLLNSFMTWRRDEGTLKFEANHHTVIFTVGSDKYTVDGKEYSLGYKLYTFDGLVMLPFDVLANALGYNCQISEFTYRITT